MVKLEDVQKYHDKDLDINISLYLAPEEIEYIGEEILKYNKQSEREYIENVLLCKVCTDIEEDYDYGNNYMLLLKNGVFFKIKSIINNYSSIEKYVNHAESVSSKIGSFIDELYEPMKGLLDSGNDFLQNVDTNKIVNLLAKKIKNG